MFITATERNKDGRYLLHESRGTDAFRNKVRDSKQNVHPHQVHGDKHTYKQIVTMSILMRLIQTHTRKTQAVENQEK